MIPVHACVLVLLVSWVRARADAWCIDGPSQPLTFSVFSLRNSIGQWVAEVVMDEGADDPRLNGGWEVEVNRSTVGAKRLQQVVILKSSIPARGSASHCGYELFPDIGYYKFHTIGKNWDDAQEVCADEGGHLAVINSEDEMKVVQQLFTRHPEFKQGTSAFVGFHDKIEEGNYVTVFGKPLSSTGFTRWSTTAPQPDNAGTKSKDCGSVQKNDGLNDFSCDAVAPFFCEKRIPGAWRENRIDCVKAGGPDKEEEKLARESEEERKSKEAEVKKVKEAEEAKKAEEAEKARKAKEAEEARKAKEAEEARKAEEAETARKSKEAEEVKKAKEAEETRKAKEAEEARKTKETEEARQAKTAEEARKVKEAEEARKAKEAEEADEARKVKEAEEARKAKEVEEARKAKEAEKARKAKEAEEARKAKEAGEARRAKEAEEARKAKEAEEAGKTKEAEEAKKVKEAEEARKTKEAEEAKKVEEAEEARQAKKVEEASKAKEAEEAEEARKKAAQQAELDANKMTDEYITDDDDESPFALEVESQ